MGWGLSWAMGPLLMPEAPKLNTNGTCQAKFLKLGTRLAAAVLLSFLTCVAVEWLVVQRLRLSQQLNLRPSPYVPVHLLHRGLMFSTHYRRDALGCCAEI
jgi:hypothetical protein